MRFSEQFVIEREREEVWRLLDDVEAVARCVPGVEEVTRTGEDAYRARITQRVGPMSATFELRLRVTEREPGRRIRITATGRSVGGAAGNVRATNAVEIRDAGAHTEVALDAEVALGGVLGTVGEKVIARQAREVTRGFAQALEAELGGGGEPAVEVAPPSAAGDAPEPSVPSPRPPADRAVAAPRGGVPGGVAAPAVAAVTALVLVLWLLLRRRPAG